MVNKTDEIGQQAKAIALLALALKKNTEQAEMDCPDEQTIASYCDDQLNSDERVKFRKNMLHCPDSYSLWMAMERHRSEWQKTEPYADENRSFLQQCYDWFITPSYLTGGIVAVASVIIVTIMLRTGLSPQELSDSYEIIRAQPGISFDYSASEFRADTGQIKGVPIFINPALKAFRDGAEISRDSINNKSNQSLNSCMKSLQTCSTATELYQYAGSWAVLMKVSCQLDSESLYEAQQILLKRWHRQWKSGLQSPAANSGLNSRLEQIYQLIQKSVVIKTELCQANDELLRFALRQ